jgi:hypothetical protein
MGLVSDAAFDLDEVPGREPERQFAAGRIFGRPRLGRLLAQERERKGSDRQEKAANDSWNSPRPRWRRGRASELTRSGLNSP